MPAPVSPWLKLLGLLLIYLMLSPAHADSLLAMAERSGNFTQFIAAAKTAGMIRDLREQGPYTLFVPTDQAFDQLPESQRDTLKTDPARLARVLRYHMIKGKVKVTEVKPGKTASVEGSLLTLTSDNGMVSVNGARVTESDVTADNGIIHAIDRVLMPPDE